MVTDDIQGEVIPVTVCVAAICDGATIFGASDRMLTAGNIQFQPPTTKIYQLTTSIAIMVSGDMALQAEILSGLQGFIRELLAADPKRDWFNVKDVAEWYSHYYDEIKSKRREIDYLLPLGLNKETYLSRQKELSPDLVQKISTELINFSLPNVSAIVAGIDNSGAHLYMIANGNTTCHDAVGFVAIGAGAYHANSYLMFSGHARSGTLTKTLLLTYTAKKRAEVAPGVGVETDMFLVGPALGSYVLVRSDIIQELDKIYVETVKGHSAVDLKAEGATHEYIETILKKNSVEPEQTATEIKDGTTSIDEKSNPKHRPRRPRSEFRRKPSKSI